MRILDVEQGTREWYDARAGIVTCSRLQDVLTGGKGITRRKYIYHLVSEIQTGKSQDKLKGEHLERGKRLEPHARELYEVRTENLIQEVGFCLDDSLKLGYSPDGLAGESGLIELKTKLAPLQIEILYENKLPSEYKAQVQGGLLVTGREWCDFCTYSPDLDLFILRVYPDLEYHQEIKIALEQFYKELEEVMKVIRER